MYDDAEVPRQRQKKKKEKHFLFWVHLGILFSKEPPQGKQGGGELLLSLERVSETEKRDKLSATGGGDEYLQGFDDF
jgi:hypothetical protein